MYQNTYFTCIPELSIEAATAQNLLQQNGMSTVKRYSTLYSSSVLADQSVRYHASLLLFTTSIAARNIVLYVSSATVPCHSVI